MEGGEEARLERALQSVQASRAHPIAKMLFNAAVDPVALGLPDYFDVIKEPMVRRNAGRLGLLVHHRPQGPALRGNRPSAF